MRRRVAFNSSPSHCFGCGADNPMGLGLEFEETPEGVEVTYEVPEGMAGAPGVVHGGIQATLLDEAMCMTAYAKSGRPVVTGELTVRYLKPAPTGETLSITGRITESRGRSFFIEGRIRLASTGEDLARAHGRFFSVEPSSGADASAPEAVGPLPVSR